MFTWWWTAPPSARTSPRRPAYEPSSSSSSAPTVSAATCTRSLLFVTLRNGVGMYTVTAMRGLLLALAEVALAGVREHGDDELGRAQFCGHGARGEGGGAGRDADQQPLLAREPPRPRERVLVAHLDDPVDDGAIQHPRDERRPDALDRVRASLAAGEHGRLRRLDGDDAHARHLRLEDLAHAGHRAPRAHARHERVESAVDRLEDLERRRAPVGLGVRGVLELLGHEVVGVLAQELLRRVDGARHALDRGRDVELRAEAREEALALDAHVVGHRQDEPVALHRGRHREPDAGVAARRLDDRRAGLEQAARLRVLEHRQRDPVLHAAARVDRLELGDDARAAGPGQPVEPDHRGPADQLEHARGDLRPRHMWYMGRAALRRARTRSASSPKVIRSTTAETAFAISSQSSPRSNVSPPFRPPGRRWASTGDAAPSAARSTSPTLICSGGRVRW